MTSSCQILQLNDERSTYESVIETTKEMFHDRGYLNISLVNNNLITATNKHGGNILALFMINKCNIQDIRNLNDKINGMKTKFDHIILIMKYKLTTVAQREFYRSKSSHGPVDKEIFLFKYMTFNPLKHVLSPEYYLLNKDESDIIIKTFGKTKMPQMLSSDRIARHFNASPGSVMKIKRKDCIYYRLITP